MYQRQLSLALTPDNRNAQPGPAPASAPLAGSAHRLPPYGDIEPVSGMPGIAVPPALLMAGNNADRQAIEAGENEGLPISDSHQRVLGAPAAGHAYGMARR